MGGKTKLELTWIGKDVRPRLEPRILLENQELSYHASHRFGSEDAFDNRLIHGDNLLSLRALEQEFSGRISCVYIDPPFNTQQAFEYYEDGLEHSVWLSMMRDRLEIIHRLLDESGSCFIHIDDNELAYLTVIADEIFGRRNRISVITFKQSSVSGPKAINPGLVTTSNFILYYAKDKSKWYSEKIFVPTSRDDRYSKYIVNIEQNYKSWIIEPLKEIFASKHGLVSKQLKKAFGDELEEMLTAFVLEDPRRVVRTARVAPKDVNEEARVQLLASQQEPNVVFRSPRDSREDYYFLNGEQLLFYSSKTKEVDGATVTAEAASTIWTDLLSNNLHKEGGVEFPNGKKPELLIKRILDLSTKPGDWVLDSFAGSGTTGAVAHKMSRRWIMVELGSHAHSHIVPRLRRVVDGADQDGASKAVGWRGGGGFRFFTLAPSLLEKDSFGNWVISRKYNAAMLAEAMCKLEGFTYRASAN